MNLYQVRIRPVDSAQAEELVYFDSRNWKRMGECVSAHVHAESLIEAVLDALSKCEGECYYAVKL